VTNISGFNFEAIRDHVGELKDGAHLEPDRVLVIPSSRITEPHFFYDPDVPHESVVLPGDLVLIDEVWAFWGTGGKLSSEHQKFFRMHRHYTEQGTGTSCDLCIMIQDLSSLHRFIRGVLESTYKFTKMKTLGLSSRYRVEVYEGNKQSRATLVSVTVKKYDKRIFPLYQSYEGGQGKEKSVDDRQNLFHNKWFVGTFAVALLALLAGGWWFVRWVGHMQNGGKEGTKVASLSNSQQPQQPGQNTPASSGPPQVVGDYRLVMVLESSLGESVVLLQTPEGRYVRRRMEAGLIDGWQSVAGYQGRMVGFSFGGKAK
jgi:zona occludens toxin